MQEVHSLKVKLLQVQVAEAEARSGKLEGAPLFSDVEDEDDDLGKSYSPPCSDHHQGIPGDPTEVDLRCAILQTEFVGPAEASTTVPKR